MVLELAKLGKEICMLSDAILRNMALDQFIILVFAFGTLPTEIKESKSLPNFRKKLKSHFYQATNNELLDKNKRNHM